MAKLEIGDWEIIENVFVGDVNGFGVAIKIAVLKEETMSDNPIYIEPGEVGFLLIVSDLLEKKMTYCLFRNLEEAVFFVNSYISFCNNINDVAANYMNYCMADEVIYKKGYRS